MAIVNICGKDMTVQGLEKKKNRSKTKIAFENVLKNCSMADQIILYDWMIIADRMHELAKY